MYISISEFQGLFKICLISYDEQTTLACDQQGRENAKLEYVKY